MQIKSVKIVRNSGADLLLIETDLPYAVWPFKGRQYMEMSVAQGMGEQYVLDNFRIEPEVTGDYGYTTPEVVCVDLEF
jgi:Tat protein secretion system quality control protein TatD with DNase activity